MADFKNNHYVPEMLLKRFMSEDGDLFYYDKRKPEKSIEHRNPSSIFCQPNLYVDVNKAGKRNVTLERDVYSRLEGDTKPILDRIVTAARKSELPKLSPEEKSTWDQFFLQQWQRTPDAFAVIFNKFDFDEKFDSSVEEFEQLHRTLGQTEKADLQTPETRNRIYKSARIKALGTKTGLTTDVLNTKGLRIVRSAKPRKSFVIGSFPVVKLNYPGRADLRDPSTEVWLPISHDLMITPWGVRGQEIHEIGNDVVIRKINKLIWEQSTEIAGRSRELLQSLLNNAGID